jgi:PAS domain S-box-containing protein
MSDSQTFDTEELIAHAPDALIFADCAGVIRLWNRAAETMLGHGAAEAIGQTLDLIVPEPYRVAHWAGFSHAVTQGRFAKDDALLTSRALTKDGRIIAVELSAGIVRSPSGQVRGIIAIGRNVTERRARVPARLRFAPRTCPRRSSTAASTACAEGRIELALRSGLDSPRHTGRIRDLIPASPWRLRIPLTERDRGSGPAYSQYFKQIVKAVVLPRP